MKSAPSVYDAPDTIRSFDGEFEALSPSYPCSVYLPGITTFSFPSFEHALLASKVKDKSIQEEISKIANIREAKKYLNSSGAVLDHAAWTATSIELATAISLDKFMRNKTAREVLKKTAMRALVFGNDRYE